MIRPVFTEVALFLLPFVLYALFLWGTRAGVFQPASWPINRVLTLAIVAMVLVLVSFIGFAEFGAAPVNSTYVPAHMENGKFVPGTIGK